MSVGVSYIRTSTPGSPGRPSCPATPGIPAFPLGPCTEEMNRMKLNKNQPKNDLLLHLSEHELSKKYNDIPFVALMKHKGGVCSAGSNPRCIKFVTVGKI